MKHKATRTPLHVAVVEEQVELVSDLINRGADVNAKDFYDVTPLHLAMETRNLSILKLLLDAGADMFAKDSKIEKGVEDLDTPVNMAVRSNNADILRLFMDAITNESAKNHESNRCVLLDLAAVWGNTKILKLLINSGPQLKRTPLHVAVVEEKIEDVSKLISKGADVNARDIYKVTPLHLAVETRNLSIMKLLLDAGADVFAKDSKIKVGPEDYNIPVNMAIKSNRVDIGRLFINAIGGVNAKAKDKQSLLHFASAWGNTKILKLLIDAGANVNARDMFKRTPLLRAWESENVNILKLLVDAGADVNAKCENKYTLLHFTVESPNISMTKFIIDAGAKVNAKSLEKSTPLHELAIWGYSDVAKLLIDAGANVKIKDDLDFTPLFRAVDVKNFDVLKVLIDSGADVNTPNIFCHTPICVAVFTEDIELVRVLIKAGANLNLKRNPIVSIPFPLHHAASVRNVHILKILLSAGADVNFIDSDGQTPLTYFIGGLVNKKEGEDENLTLEGLNLLIKLSDMNLTRRNGRNIFDAILGSNALLPVRELFYKQILEKIAKLMALGHNVDRDLLNTISGNGDYNDYFLACTKELGIAKSTKLHDCWVTFFNLLVDDKSKFVKYAGNEDLVEDFKKNIDKFPIYGAKMHKNISKGINTRRSLDGAAMKLSYYLPVFDPNHLIVRDTLSILSEEDWEKLSDKKHCSE